MHGILTLAPQRAGVCAAILAALSILSSPPLSAQPISRTALGASQRFDVIDDPFEAQIRECLSATVTSPLGSLSLEDMAATLRRGGIPTDIDRAALEEVGAAAELKVASSLSGLPLSTVLRRMLAPHELSWVVHGRLLLITTNEGAEAAQARRIYPVGDLLPWVRQPAFFGGMAEGFDFDSLVDLITASVQPDVWEEVGGPSSIAPYDLQGRPLLIVFGTESVHEDVAQFFALMRTTLRSTPPSARQSLGGVSDRRRSSLRSSSTLPRTNLRPSPGVFGGGGMF